MCVEHDLPDPLLKDSGTVLCPVDEYWGKGLPVWCDRGPETIVHAVTMRLFAKLLGPTYVGIKISDSRQITLVQNRYPKGLSPLVQTTLAVMCYHGRFHLATITASL
jgi:hypothetical protein